MVPTVTTRLGVVTVGKGMFVHGVVPGWSLFLRSSATEMLQTMMKATVDSGTGKSLKGVMTGAKTGTAQWGKAGALQTHAWMIAYNDKYAVASFVEVGDSGGSTAAPLILQLLR